MLVFMGGVLSRLTSGLWIHSYGFIAPTWLILACHVASALWVIFLVPENPERAINVKNKFFDCKNLKTLVDVFKKKREGGRKSLLLLVFTGAIITLTTQGLGGVTALFVMRSPLCFSPKLVGYFLAYRMFIAGLGGAIGVKLLRKFFSEMVTSGISMVCQMGEMVLLAFATRTWLVFLGGYDSTITLFKRICYPRVNVTLKADHTVSNGNRTTESEFNSDCNYTRDRIVRPEVLVRVTSYSQLSQNRSKVEQFNFSANKSNRIVVEMQERKNPSECVYNAHK